MTRPSRELPQPPVTCRWERHRFLCSVQNLAGAPGNSVPQQAALDAGDDSDAAGLKVLAIPCSHGF